MRRYQHVVPQREQDHAVKPDAAWAANNPFRPPRCKECLKPIKVVPEDDSPEGLKTLLRW